MSVPLPPSIAIKSSQFQHYLNYNSDSNSYPDEYGYLKFDGDNVFSPLAKFQVVTANTGVTGLVHIRCTHNKKLLRVVGKSNINITPGADEPQEDTSKWSCTLFEPRAADGNPNCVRLLHVQQQRYSSAQAVTITDGHGTPTSVSTRFHLGSKDPAHEDKRDVMEITDLEGTVILPKHVAFKADNGKYLAMEDDQTLVFTSRDKGAAAAWFEVSTDNQGRAQIKPYKAKAFLRFDKEKNKICADKTTNSTDNQTAFLPVKVGNNVVALRSSGNNHFYGRSRVETAYLNATFPTISKEARLELEELVISRSIYDSDLTSTMP